MSINRQQSLTFERFLNRLKTQKAHKLFAYSYPCPYCGVKLTEDNITRDHVIPRSIINKWHKTKVNRNEFNIVFCCYDCNNLKGDKPLLQFLNLLPSKPTTSTKRKYRKHNPPFLHPEQIFGSHHHISFRS